MLKQVEIDGHFVIITLVLLMIGHRTKHLTFSTLSSPSRRARLNAFTEIDRTIDEMPLHLCIFSIFAWQRLKIQLQDFMNRNASLKSHRLKCIKDSCFSKDASTFVILLYVLCIAMHVY